MAVTVMELATHRLGRDATTGQDYIDARLPMMGGCYVCEASIAAYNAYPSQIGFLMCGDDIGGDGWDTVEEANKAIFGEDG